MNWGGSRLPISGPGNSCSCPLGPPPCQKLHRAPASAVVHWHFSLRVVSTSPLPSSCSYFPVEPGRDLESRRLRYPVPYRRPCTTRSPPPCEESCRCGRSPLRPLHGHHIVFPFLWGSASLLPSWTLRVGVFLSTDGGGRRPPYAPPQHTRSATSAIPPDRLPCGHGLQRFIHLLLPLLRSIPSVRVVFRKHQ
jgi:hypothetical protein